MSAVLSDTSDREDTKEPAPITTISDFSFMHDLKRLKELRSFLINEAINLRPEDDSRTLSFGGLNLLTFGEKGRRPTEEEWTAIETHTQTLFQLMTEPLRRRFLLGQIPAWIAVLPIIFCTFAVVSLIGAATTPHVAASPGVGIGALSLYVIWLVSLGAVGSVAFIGMNALSIQQDATFDLNNKRLMILRITLGVLFALVLAIPFGFESFMQFADQLSKGQSRPEEVAAFSKQVMFLLLPFVLGFSTSLVMMILNRLVDAIQIFFGKNPSGTSAGTASVSSPTSARLKRF